VNSAGSVQVFSQLCPMCEQVVTAASKDEIGTTSRILVHMQPQIPLAVLRGEAVLTGEGETEDTRVRVAYGHDEPTQIIKKMLLREEIKGHNIKKIQLIRIGLIKPMFVQRQHGTSNVRSGHSTGLR